VGVWNGAISLPDNKPFLVLADYLTRRGVAVLRVDDRGVGGLNRQHIHFNQKDPWSVTLW
jgi:hypothetical protein